MVQSEYFRGKLAHSKFGGQNKAYVDSNLQLHLQEEVGISSTSHHPIYAHFTHSSSLENTNDELTKEIKGAMDQAEQSYRAWKRIHDLINLSLENKKIKLN